MAKKTKSFHDILLRTFEKIASNNIIGHIYTKFFEKMTIDEFSMINIHKDFRVLHIGCGGIPNTLLILAQHVEAKYVGIDRDPAAVAQACSMIDKYGLTNYVTIQQDNAIAHPFHSYDVIIVSLGVEPREEVFARIRKQASDSAIILARKPWDFLDKIYGKNPFVPLGFDIVNTFYRQDFIKSLLLEKHRNA